jgi:hypothetical protein
MKEIYLSTISSMVKVLRDKPLTAFPELKGSALKNEGKRRECKRATDQWLFGV